MRLGFKAAMCRFKLLTHRTWLSNSNWKPFPRSMPKSCRLPARCNDRLNEFLLGHMLRLSEWPAPSGWWNLDFFWSAKAYKHMAKTLFLLRLRTCRSCLGIQRYKCLYVASFVEVARLLLHKLSLTCQLWESVCVYNVMQAWETSRKQPASSH